MATNKPNSNFQTKRLQIGHCLWLTNEWKQLTLHQNAILFVILTNHIERWQLFVHPPAHFITETGTGDLHWTFLGDVGLKSAVFIGFGSTRIYDSTKCEIDKQGNLGMQNRNRINLGKHPNLCSFLPFLLILFTVKLLLREHKTMLCKKTVNWHIFLSPCSRIFTKTPWRNVKQLE